MNQQRKRWPPAKTNAGIIACIFFLSITCRSFSQSPVAIKGSIDLRQWNWEKDGIAGLNGEWEFYWNQLYTPASFDSSKNILPSYIRVPDYWNNRIPGLTTFSPGFGYATYRLKILCPPSSEKLALKFLTIGSAYKVFVNGKEVLQVGKVGNHENSATDFKPAIIAAEPENNELNLVIQVSNFAFNEGGIWDFVKLGTVRDINSDYIENVAHDFFVSGSFFLISIFYFVLFFFFRRRLTPLYFSIFCLLLAIRPLVTDEMAITYFVNWDWRLIKHIEFISFYLTVPVLSLFSFQLLPQEFSRKILAAILLVTTPFVLISIFGTPLVFRYPIKIFQLIMFVTALYGLYIYILALKNKQPGSIYLLIGFVMLFITIINDILNARFIIHTGNFIYAGLFIFTISQAITISKQFFWTYTRLEVANKRLAEINEELNNKNSTIVEKNDQLSKLNVELDSLVYRTSHDLRSPITSVITLIEIIRDEKDEAKRNEYLSAQKRILFRLNSLIEGTLDFVKNKRLELKYEPIEFLEFINNALYDHKFAEDSLHVQRMVDVKQEGAFYTDASRLNIIINNLISNALKYHDTHKNNSYLKISVHADDKHANIEVTDNGVGIDRLHLADIFTIFYRANESYKGSGIGLNIVKDAVEKLGGSVAVQSVIAQGTRFIIDIPNHLPV